MTRRACNPSNTSSARSIVLLLALIVSTASGFAQNVGGFIHGKIQNFQQTSSAAPVVNSAAPFQFGSLITFGTATITSATLTFTGTASPRAYDAVGSGDFSILDTFTTQAQLDSAYQNGNFTVNINTSAGIFSRTIFLFPFTYPTTAQLTVPANDWQGGTLVIDPTLDYTFTWNAFANAQAADVIQLVIRNSSVNLAPFPATQTSFTLPAGSLQPNTIYSCDLVFVRVAGATAGDADIGPGFATLAKDTVSQSVPRDQHRHLRRHPPLRHAYAARTYANPNPQRHGDSISLGDAYSDTDNNSHGIANSNRDPYGHTEYVGKHLHAAACSKRR